ncbi:MAG: DEAD/DEAH box helicase [Actinomycetota bacterium]
MLALFARPQPCACTLHAARRALNREVNTLAQLRSATTLERIRPTGGQLPRFTYNTQHLTEIAYLVRLAEIERSQRQRRLDPGALPDVARAFEDLARRADVPADEHPGLLAQAAAMWSLAGYQANASVLARQLLEALTSEGTVAEPPARPVPERLACLVAALIARDIDLVLRLATDAVEAVQTLGEELADGAGDGLIDLGDAALLAAYGLVGRAAGSAAGFWREGSPEAAKAALDSVREASGVLLRAYVVDSWLLVHTRAAVLADAFAVSPWRRLRGHVRDWNGLWRRHIRLLAHANPPIVELWPSQLRALDKGFLGTATLAVHMPTSAGTTRLAEYALLAALADLTSDRLGVFIVPSRALAAEVEERLHGSLGRVGLRVSALFGGFDHLDYELDLLENTDVLVATAEKLDLLFRQEPGLADRLAVVIVDEAHLLHQRDRGLGLEFLTGRLRRRAPKARVLLMSAVLPNVEDIGRWLEPEAAGLNVIKEQWTPSRLVTGIFHWERGRPAIGQTGTVRYPGDEFFLPSVLRRERRTNRVDSTPYPKNKNEDAAELALHYERLGPVLIGVATKPQCE